MRPSALIKQWIELLNNRDQHQLAMLYHQGIDIHQMLPEGSLETHEPEAINVEIKRKNIIESLIEHKNWAILKWRSSEGLAQWIVFCILNGKIAFQRNYSGDCTEIFS